MIGPDTMEPVGRVFRSRPVESPGRGIFCWNSGSPIPAMPAKDQVVQWLQGDQHNRSGDEAEAEEVRDAGQAAGRK